MAQAWIPLVVLIMVLAMMPKGLQWLQRRVAGDAEGVCTPPRIISAVGVGPHQRVVTVEVGPDGSRVWLTLGVTAQSITCLHTTLAPKIGSGVVETVPTYTPNPKL